MDDYSESEFDLTKGLHSKFGIGFSDKPTQIAQLSSQLAFDFPDDFVDSLGHCCACQAEGEYVIGIPDGLLCFSGVFTVDVPGDELFCGIAHTIRSFSHLFGDSPETAKLLPFTSNGSIRHSASRSTQGWLSFARTDQSLHFVPGRPTKNPFTKEPMPNRDLLTAPIRVSDSFTKLMSVAIYRHYG